MALKLSPLERLRLADPETYAWVKGRLAMISPPPASRFLTLLTSETIRALAQESGMGAAVAKGLLRLMEQDCYDGLPAFVDMVRRAAQTGATLGRIVATFSVPALLAGDSLTDRFQNTLAVMQAKGTYTLTAPFEVLAELLAAGDADSAAVYLDMLAAVFGQDISYNQSLRLVYLLPKAVRAFTPRRREAQISQLKRVVKTDILLVDAFLDGIQKGLGLLDDKALSRFVAQALIKYRQAPDSGAKFMGLSSKVGQDACRALQKAIPLIRIKGQLNRYLHARMGCSVGVKSLSELPAAQVRGAWVCSDGRFIYLPDEIDRFATRNQNMHLYKALVKIEAGFFEERTFDFDLERAADGWPAVARWMAAHPPAGAQAAACDGERFIRGFPQPLLANDLFTLFEQARVARLLARRYPGLMRRVRPLMQAECRRLYRQNRDHPLAPVYAGLVWELDMQVPADSGIAALQNDLAALFYERSHAHSPVEASADLVCAAFDRISRAGGGMLSSYHPLALPFGRCMNWELVSSAFAAHELAAARIKVRLEEKGVRVYRSDLRNRLAARQGQISADDIDTLVLARSNGKSKAGPAIDWRQLGLDDLFKTAVVVPLGPNTADFAAFHYPEWDCHLQDYLNDYARVQEILLPDESGDDFYRQTLVRHRGAVSQMRRAFELLKPEGLAMLRQWPEGDAFDYRALLDFAIDRRAGQIPSDRLFIKRLKQQRDVAVLLLVDLSRSTANTVSGGHTTVLDVAKEALVLFCEALQVVGDSYAIAGFSGTGRHSVDYYCIKDFQEPLTGRVQARISALSPQRSTRMGAAIRHAKAQLEKSPTRVRLLIVVSDGFPNDLGYKAEYAIADTRRAVQEARARNFHVKAITVNIGSDPKLDDLYGRVHHHVIGDVCELPQKLLRLYGTLTKF